MILMSARPKLTLVMLTPIVATLMADTCVLVILVTRVADMSVLTLTSVPSRALVQLIQPVPILFQVTFVAQNQATK